MNQAEKENGMDVEKTIEFLLRQQAQFSSDLSALMQQQTQFRADLAALSNTVTELTGTVDWVSAECGQPDSSGE
jgi:hypothetical protein